MTKLQRFTSLSTFVFLYWASAVHADVVSEWNALAAQCSTSRPGPAGLLDLAIVQAAVHDAVQAIEHRYEPYLAVPAATGDESLASAAAAAAYYVLSSTSPAICPATMTATLDAAFKPYLEGKDPGLLVGQMAATRLLQEYRAIPVPPPADFTGGTGIGEWRPTPPAEAPMAYLFLATTKPFTLDSPSQLRPRPPPALTSNQYLRDYNEVKRFGAVESHPAAPGACPAPPRTDVARFWSANIIPQWNEAIRLIALDEQLSIGDSARLLALANLAAADSLIAVWDSKRYYHFWRPLTAIREGNNDTNNETVGDAAWTPFIQSAHLPMTGVPATTSQTPPYPDYVSGASGVTGAFTTILQLYFRTDWLKFEIYKAGPPSVAICTNPRTYRRISDAAQEVVDARVWLGIHFRFADEEGRRLGTRVAFQAFTEFLRPIPGHKER